MFRSVIALNTNKRRIRVLSRTKPFYVAVWLACEYYRDVKIFAARTNSALCTVFFWQIHFFCLRAFSGYKTVWHILDQIRFHSCSKSLANAFQNRIKYFNCYSLSVRVSLQIPYCTLVRKLIGPAARLRVLLLFVWLEVDLLLKFRHPLHEYITLCNECFVEVWQPLRRQNTWQFCREWKSDVVVCSGVVEHCG